MPMPNIFQPYYPAALDFPTQKLCRCRRTRLIFPPREDNRFTRAYLGVTRFWRGGEAEACEGVAFRGGGGDRELYVVFDEGLGGFRELRQAANEDLRSDWVEAALAYGLGTASKGLLADFWEGLGGTDED